MVGVDAAIIMNPRVWVASGHVDTFADPMVDCKSCQRRFRADELMERKHEPESVHGHKVDTSGYRCPECGGDERSAEPAGETSDGVFFSVRCVACGHTGLYNASELINKYGEYVGT